MLGELKEKKAVNLLLEFIKDSNDFQEFSFSFIALIKIISEYKDIKNIIINQIKQRIENPGFKMQVVLQGNSKGNLQYRDQTEFFKNMLNKSI